MRYTQGSICLVVWLYLYTRPGISGGAGHTQTHTLDLPLGGPERAAHNN